MDLISLRAYARHRGCTLHAVQKAIATGRIDTFAGKINPQLADLQWARNTARLPMRVSGEMLAAKVRRAQAEADLAEMELAERRASLVSAAEVRAAMDRRVAELAQCLDEMTARLVLDLAGETDKGQVHAKIRRAVRETLAAFANSLDAR